MLKLKCRLSGSLCERIIIGTIPEDGKMEVDPTLCLGCPFFVSKIPHPLPPDPRDPRRPRDPFNPDLRPKRPLEF